MIRFLQNISPINPGPDFLGVLAAANAMLTFFPSSHLVSGHLGLPGYSFHSTRDEDVAGGDTVATNMYCSMPFLPS